jgi:hypothetical protein
VRAYISLVNGNRPRALTDQERAFELAQARDTLAARLGACINLATVHAELGDFDSARRLAVDVPPLVREFGVHGALMRLAPFAEELGIADELREALTVEVGLALPVWRRTVELALAGDLSAAADVIAEAGSPTLEANLRRHAGLRGGADGQAQLERALAFYRSVDASHYVAEIEAALAGAQSESA